MDRIENITAKIYEVVRRYTPKKIILLLHLLKLTEVVKRWDPRQNPDEHVWPLKGSLEGHIMRFRKAEEFQFSDLDYESAVSTAIAKLVEPGWVCADVGAHIGFFTLLLAKLAGGGGRVYAFEASPENAELLSLNVELNKYQDRVVVENLAVSDGKQDILNLYAGPSSFEATIMPFGEMVMVQVPAIALDSYFPVGSQLDFVKMDIEGGEVLAIPGMMRLLTDNQPIVLLEIHTGGNAAVEFLSTLGYQFLDLNFQPIYPERLPWQDNHCIAIPITKTINQLV